MQADQAGFRFFSFVSGSRIINESFNFEFSSCNSNLELIVQSEAGSELTIVSQNQSDA